MKALALAAIVLTAGAWLHEYARPAQTQCRTGWGESWAQWPNNGTGGSVCTILIQHRTQLTHREGETNVR